MHNLLLWIENNLLVSIFIAASIGFELYVFSQMHLIQKLKTFIILHWEQLTDESVDQVVTKSRQLERKLESANNIILRHEIKIRWLKLFVKSIYPETKLHYDFHDYEYIFEQIDKCANANIDVKEQSTIYDLLNLPGSGLVASEDSGLNALKEFYKK